MTGLFGEWQPRYAAHGIALVPVQVIAKDKKPLTKGYNKTGLRGSADLALKFAEAQAFGFVCGVQNRVTVVDMDSTDPAIVTEGERLFGASPLLWRTGGGKYAMAFRHNGEPRLIKPDALGGNIDLLGGGLCIAPPSVGRLRPYEYIRGTLDDLDRLPVARMPPELAKTARSDGAHKPAERIPEGRRNNALFDYCRSIVNVCDDFDKLLDAAETWAEDRVVGRLSHAEIRATCTSVWNHRGGRKRMVCSPYLEGEQFDTLSRDPVALALFAYFSMHEGSGAVFMCADGLAHKLGWSRRSIPAARRMLLDLRIIECVQNRGPGQPALYRWAVPHD
jgi:hypothetical protein